MIDVNVHGVALIKVAVGPINPQEFYGVFFNGVLQPIKYLNWVEADRKFRGMMTFAANRREAAEGRSGVSA